MNKSNNNRPFTRPVANRNATTSQSVGVRQPRNPVQGRGRGPRPQMANRSPGLPSLGASAARPPRGQIGVAAAYATGLSQRAPVIVASRDQSRIVHRELIGSMTGSVAFAVAQTIPLNPGMATFAPWLSSQASAWERYRFNKLRFCYYTRTGSNVPGSMLLVPDYDAADAAPVSEQVASSYEDVEEDAPWKDICCVLKPSSLHALGPSKFIRSAALAANLDIKTYDAGNLFACTTDGTAVNWGKLWVEYDVTLLTPQLNPAGSSGVALHISGGGPTTVNILGGAPLVAAGSTPIASVAGSVLTFAGAGEYLVEYSVAAGTSATAAAPTLGAGVTTISTVNPGSFATSGSGTQQLSLSALVKAPAGGTVTFNNTLVLGSQADLFVAPVPSNLA